MPSCAVGTTEMKIIIVLGPESLDRDLETSWHPKGKDGIRVRIVLFLHLLTNVGMGQRHQSLMVESLS